MPHLGTARTDARSVPSLQLEDSFADRGFDHPELLLRIFDEAIRGEHLVVFLDHLLRCIPGKLLIVWDGLPAHRGKFGESTSIHSTAGSRFAVFRLTRRS